MLGHIDCHGHTDCGRLRAKNEDQFLIGDMCRSVRVYQSSLSYDSASRLYGGDQGKIFAVADGLGGHQSGERASQLAIDGVVNHLLNEFDSPPSDGRSDGAVQQQLEDAFHQSQERILRETPQETTNAGRMGTTLTVGFVLWPRLHLTHVGDSRCYLHRHGMLQRLTHDHTFAELSREMSVAGRLSPQELTNAESVLWNALGVSHDEPRVDTLSVDLCMGDSLLFVTDGVYQQIPHERLTELIDAAKSAEEACLKITREASEAGGIDNATAVVCRFVEDQARLTYEEESASREEPSTTLDLADQTRDMPVPA